MADVYVFWDNSNMFISAKTVAENKEGSCARDAVRLDFVNLMSLATARRQVIKAVAVGSVPPEEKALWDRMAEDTKIEIELYGRGKQSGKEQGADQCLQIHMLRAGDDEKTPKVAVLLTGDGKGYEDGKGFLADITRLYDKGWGIEVLSWEHSCKRELKNFAQQNGVFVPLDNYFEAITFINGVRAATPLPPTPRKTIEPRKSELELKELEIASLKAELERNKRKKDYGERVNRRKSRK